MTKEATTTQTTKGELVTLMGESYYRIQNYDALPPFFMTIVSSDNHWLFVSSTGGLTAGRIDANHALFPYYTEDRITENADNTGCKSILHVIRDGKANLWEPFIDRIHNPYTIKRALYKNITGTALIFEEANADLGLIFRYAWRTSARYGIVKTAWIINSGDAPTSITLTDGIQNVLPALIAAGTQNEFSVLLDAYKRSELEPTTGLGIFSLSSRLTDLAEPSEALRANVAWQVGLDDVTYMLSSQQLSAIRQGQTGNNETDIRGKRGAYFVQSTLTLAPNTEKTWHIVAEVNQDAATIADLIHKLQNKPHLAEMLDADIVTSQRQLRAIVAGADGLQVSGDPLSTEHHFANVLFNVMRGGTFFDQYNIDKADFVAYIETHYRQLLTRHAGFFESLPSEMTIQTLKQASNAQKDPDLIRLSYAYLPLMFSRRHGDPSRPWNRFAIHLKNADGTPQLNYEGNWRDIFQNWEALSYTYPEFIDGMISVFANATTIDGYNPYRIMRDGIDWEVPEPSNPWANIGYWSDHQIIYLQKLMEVCERFYPGKLNALLTRSIFSYANVPYRIKPYAEIVQDPYSTIDFDWDAEKEINKRVDQYGTDGKLLMGDDDNIILVTLGEKLLNLLLAKMVNFVPDGGIWMNTQRPEWNDANNALVGKGLSVVTTGYLRRYVVFFQDLLARSTDELLISKELHTLFETVKLALADYHASDQRISAQERRTIMDTLGNAGSDYRQQCYAQANSGEFVSLNHSQLTEFLARIQEALNQTIRMNRRDDGLYHAYNTLELPEGVAQIHHLNLMLEGQVAVMSSGLLAPDEVLHLLQQLRKSPLYREDQHSYILYPDRELPGFLSKNTIDATLASQLELVQALIKRNDSRLITRDSVGDYHFGGDLRNKRDLTRLLDNLARDSELSDLVVAEGDDIHKLFEQVFRHDMFTGRSGSFFAYEGLGSIYWHMISKLLLAVQENVQYAAMAGYDNLPALIDAYYDIRAGLGFNKSPHVYGAFPLDPYSHTPSGQGAKQPGMTGMVKEEILTRLVELGIVIEAGAIVFDPLLLRQTEFLEASSTLEYWNTDNQFTSLAIPAGSFAFTLCRVPIVVQQSDKDQFVLVLGDGAEQVIAEHRLDADMSQHIFAYDDIIRRITIHTKHHVLAL